MTTITLYSETGCGKSLQAGSFREEGDVIIFDEENRLAEYEYDEKLIPIAIKKNITFPDSKNLTIIPLKRYRLDFKEDTITSFDAFVSQVSKTIREKPPRTVVVDGISDIRSYAHDTWCKVNNRKAAMNPGDWEKVNNLVRNELFPLLNWGRVKGVNIIFTAQMKDNYQKIKKSDGSEESVKAGRIVACKDEFGYNTDIVIELWRPVDINKKPLPIFMATCIKSARPTSLTTKDITGLSLYEVLLEESVIE